MTDLILALLKLTGEFVVVGLRVDESVMEEKVCFSWTMWVKHHSTLLFDRQKLS